MKLGEVNGYLVECTDPAHVRGVHIGWISSPKDRMILGTGRGDNPTQAVLNALDDWMKDPPPGRLSTHDLRTAAEIRQRILTTGKA